MITPPILCYCADGNPRFADIAIEHGFKYGSQMPRKCYRQPWFIDVNPKKLPKQPVYIARLRKWRPYMASVHDWSEERRLPEILMRAEEIARYCERVLLIPKVHGGVALLPREIGGKLVVLGYSVPTSHGATTVEPREFAGWPVHLLGGSPQRQMELFQEMTGLGADVVSIDGNYAQMMTRHNQFWVPGTADYARNRYWPTIIEADSQPWGDGSKTADAPYEAFRRSCENIMNTWETIHFEGIANVIG